MNHRVQAIIRRTKPATGQALPVAMVALALGALLVTPLLLGASTSSRATSVTGIRAHDRYSMDAGVEWSGWRLMSNPRLTTDTSYTSAPLAPFPSLMNGQPFPQTEIRYVPGAGAVEALNPPWQGGGGDKCYTFTVSEAGTLSVRVTVDTGDVWLAVLPDGASCTRPPGLLDVFGDSPYSADFGIPAAGTYQLLVGTDTATTGTIELSAPAASYDVRSARGSRSIVARLVAGSSGVRVESWQLN